MTERKYRKPVNENGWMRRLQKFTWGKAVPKFVGYCPFFWFTWLCVLIFPVTLLCKATMWIVATAFIIIIAGVPKRAWILRPSDSQLVNFYTRFLEYGLAELRDGWGYDDIVKWIDVTPDWENCVKRIIAKRQKKAERKAIREPKHAAFTNKLARYSGIIVKPILVALILVVAYFALPPTWTGLVFIWRALLSITTVDLLWMLKATGISAACVCLLWLIFMLAGRFACGFKGCPKRPEKIGWTERIGMAFSAGLEFICETIETLYTRECPLIEWGTRSESIQRRETSPENRESKET